MLERVAIRNLTVFSKADLEFARNLNVIVGENGTGKTHLLKIAYAMLAVGADLGRRSVDAASALSQSAVEVRLGEKLVGVFRPEKLGNLVRRKARLCNVQMEFDNPQMNVEFTFASDGNTEVRVKQMPQGWAGQSPAFFPTRELLTIYPRFVSVYENHYLDFEETWRDTCVLLARPLLRGSKEGQVRKLLNPLERAMGGEIQLDRNGRFYLNSTDGRTEMPLVAEGLRKLGMLAILIANGVLLDGGYLFWDEPEANLNPKLIREIARSVLALSSAGIQVFLATHSLFLLREIEILLSSTEFAATEAKFLGLHSSSIGVSVQEGTTADEIGDITALDEVLQQSDRFLAEK